MKRGQKAKEAQISRNCQYKENRSNDLASRKKSNNAARNQTDEFIAELLQAQLANAQKELDTEQRCKEKREEYQLQREIERAAVEEAR